MNKIMIGLCILSLLIITGCQNSSFDNCMDFCLTKENPDKSFVIRDGGVYECTPLCLKRYLDTDKCYDECRGIQGGVKDGKNK